MGALLAAAERAFADGRHARARDLCDLGLNDGPGADAAALARWRGRAALALARTRTGGWRALPEVLRSGMVLRDEGAVAEALPLLERAVADHPSCAEAHTFLGLALLALGDLPRGFAEYEWRQRIPGWRPAPSPAPRWDGRPDPGGTLLLWDEQGLGDAIQFARYTEAAAAAHRGRVILMVNPRLGRLLCACPGADAVASRAAIPPAAGAQLALMSLPAVLGLAGAGLAGRVPYLRADAGLAAAWGNRLRALGRGPRVGLVWQGNPAYAADRQRAVPLEALVPLVLRHAGRCTFLGLQKGAGVEALRALPAGAPVADLGAELDRGRDGFVDTAAALASIDLLITSDTSAAHLAGALGRPVWLLLGRVPDWRWGPAGARTLWYPSTRIFRAPDGDWHVAVAAVSEALAAWEPGA